MTTMKRTMMTMKMIKIRIKTIMMAKMTRMIREAKIKRNLMIWIKIMTKKRVSVMLMRKMMKIRMEMMML